MAAGIASSCIRDDGDNCPVADDFLLYVKIEDVESGRDITGDVEVEEVVLTLFDPAGRFVATYILDGEDISRRRPVVLRDFDVEGMQVSAWGDVGGEVLQNDPQGHNIGHDFVTLAVDSDGFSGSPDDFFFGFLSVSSQVRSAGSQEVVLTQKNSKLHLTVRGLEDRDDQRYYFAIESPADGYGFTGIPNGRPCLVRHTGKFTGNDLVSPEPCLMIHSSPADDAAARAGVVVNLYYKGDQGDRLLARVDWDIEGNTIELPSGRTTNVLIELTGGSLDVRVEVTGWRQVYQWPVW
ncbi:MAG: FimB/Mfa2 family fimbrial subunit [Alistipes sp.]|nr:FimB/Mfa2 family fimbrial subunit [Alistipes sp.]